MANNQELETGAGGETPAGEQKEVDRTSEAAESSSVGLAEAEIKAGEAAASESEPPASAATVSEPPASAGGEKLDTAQAQSTDTSTETSAATATDMNTQQAPVPPAGAGGSDAPRLGAQLSPNAPRTVKKPVEQKPAEAKTQKAPA